MAFIKQTVPIRYSQNQIVAHPCMPKHRYTPRMHQDFKQSILMGAMILISVSLPLQGSTVSIAPANIQASLFVKLLPYNKNISGGGDVVIYVLDTPAVAKAMKSAVGRKLGKSRLADIIAISKVPKEKPQARAVLYLADRRQVKAATAFCHKHKILSMTGNPALAKQGITLTVGIENKKPKILLNLTATKKESIDWHPDILKVATKVK